MMETPDADRSRWTARRLAFVVDNAIPRVCWSDAQGPVYNVQWSPFRPGLFVSCSSDWTVRLWTEEKEHELLIFQSASEQVCNTSGCICSLNQGGLPPFLRSPRCFDVCACPRLPMEAELLLLVSR